MSKIYSGCASLNAELITAGFDFSCASFQQPVEGNFARDFSDPPMGFYLALNELGKLHPRAENLVTKDTSNATMISRLRSYDDSQPKRDDRFTLANIDSGNCNSSVSRLASAALTSGRFEQLNVPLSERHTRGPRLWQ
jgi:hypothetical protein